jgi:hypothetical protein
VISVLEIQRLLAAIGAFRATAGPQLALLADQGRTGDLLELLDDQRLTSLLGSRAMAIGGNRLPPSFTGPVLSDLASNRVRNLAIEALATRLVLELENAGIRTLPLKGPFLARRLYDDVGMRSVNDLDLLVSRRNLDRAAAVLCSCGYRSEPVPPREKRFPDLHYVLRDPRGQLPRIDLHWRIHWHETEFSEAMLNRSSPGKAGFRVASADDELVALLLYYARDGLFGLRGPADIAGWWDRYGESTTVPVLDQQWDDHPLLRRPMTAAAIAAQRTVGVPAASIIGGSRPIGARVRLADRLANWTQEGEFDQLAANIDLVDGLLTSRGSTWSFLRRCVLLDSEQVRRTYGFQKSNNVRITIWQLLHGPKILVRWLIGSIGSLLGRREKPLQTVQPG